MRIARQRCIGWTLFRVDRVRRFDEEMGWTIQLGKYEWTVFW